MRKAAISSFRWVRLSCEISLCLPWDLLRYQKWVKTIFLFALAPKCHGYLPKYLCRANSSTLRYCLPLCMSQHHKGRWRFVTLVQPEFTLLCPVPQRSITAAGAELGKRPALSFSTPVLPSPSCENLGGMTPLPLCLSCTPVFLHTYRPLCDLNQRHPASSIAPISLWQGQNLRINHLILFTIH